MMGNTDERLVDICLYEKQAIAWFNWLLILFLKGSSKVSDFVIY